MIRKATMNDLPRLTELSLELWPDNAVDTMYYDLGKIMMAGDSVFFLAYRENVAVGFAQCQLRHGYVEGTSSSPVAYSGGYLCPGRRPTPWLCQPADGVLRGMGQSGGLYRICQRLRN